MRGVKVVRRGVPWEGGDVLVFGGERTAGGVPRIAMTRIELEVLRGHEHLVRDTLCCVVVVGKFTGLEGWHS